MVGIQIVMLCVVSKKQLFHWFILNETAEVLPDGQQPYFTLYCTFQLVNSLFKEIIDNVMVQTDTTCKTSAGRQEMGRSEHV